MESAFYGVYTLVVLYQKSHSFASLTCSISDTPQIVCKHRILYLPPPGANEGGKMKNPGNEVAGKSYRICLDCEDDFFSGCWIEE